MVNVQALRLLMLLVDLADTVAGRAIPLGSDQCFNLIFNRVGELVATLREELNAVVSHRVV